MMVWSLVRLSASFVMQLCRRSWKRILRPARVKAARQADLHDLMGRDGSIRSLSGFLRSSPAASQAGNTYSSGFDSGNRPVHFRRAVYGSGLKGISCPLLPSVLVLPTISSFLRKSIWFYRRVRISFLRSAVFSARVTTENSNGLDSQALRSFFYSSWVRALPVPSDSRSNFTSPCRLAHSLCRFRIWRSTLSSLFSVRAEVFSAFRFAW